MLVYIVAGVALFALTIATVIIKKDSIYGNDLSQQNVLAKKKVIFIEDINDKENADGKRGHLEAIGDVNYKPGIYDRFVKRFIDIVLSLVGLIVLTPIFLFFVLAIKIDDPGPAFFTQKRIGRNKQYFKLHKFRSMKMSTPHDTPTHMLDNPNQYITKIGGFVRRHSLDGNVIIGQTTESLVNRGFREVSPIHFFTGRDLFSKSYNDFHVGGEGLLVA